MAGKEMNTVKEFLTAFSAGNTQAYRTLLSEDICADYSVLGTFRGIDSVSRNITVPEQFDDFTVTVLNTVSYTDGDQTLISLIGQHLNYYEDTPYLFPTVFGGHYIFSVNRLTGKITEITFRLDYQGENTYCLRNWNLSDGHHSGNQLREAFSCEKARESILASENTDKEKAVLLTKLYLTAWNMKDVSYLKAHTAAGTAFSREKTYSNGKITGTISACEQYIREIEDYYDLNEWGARVSNPAETETGYKTDFQLLSPYRLGTKKLTSANKFSSFYDEAGTVCFDHDWNVTAFDCIKVAEIYMNGFDILEA